MKTSIDDLVPTRTSGSHSRWFIAARPEGRMTFDAAEVCLIIVSFLLLMLTCVDARPARDLAVLSWLLSFSILAVWNIGAALGLYVSAVALYSNFFSSAIFAPFERPDHAALLILIGSLALLRSKGGTRLSVDRIALTVLAFLVYGMINGFLTGTFSTRNVAQVGRMWGIPLVLFLLTVKAGTRSKDLWSFIAVVTVIAFHSAVVSVLWQFDDLRMFIFPLWITDPAVNQWADSTRAGGLVMQPGWNGLMLGLEFCLLYLAYHRWVHGVGRGLLLIVGVSVLVGIYLTYTRAAYLGALTAVTGLFWMRVGKDPNVTARRLALVIVSVMGLAFAFVARPATLEDRVGKESTAVWRIEIWKIAFDMIPARPLFGFGLRGYNENAYKYLEESEVLRRGSIEERQPAVHNTLLNVMVEFGLVGFSLYVILHLLILLQASQRARERWGRQGVVWVLIFMSVYFIKAQFGVSQEPTTNAIFYGCLGLLAGLPIRQRPETRIIADGNSATPVLSIWPQDR